MTKKYATCGFMGVVLTISAALGGVTKSCLGSGANAFSVHDIGVIDRQTQQNRIVGHLRPSHAQIYLARAPLQLPQIPPAPVAPLVRVQSLNSDGVNTLSFSPDGKTIAVATMSLQLWDLKTGRMKAKLEDSRFPLLTQAVFSPKEPFIASIAYQSDDEDEDVPSALLLWNSQSHKLVRIIESINSKTAYWRNVAFSPDSLLLASTHGRENGSYGALRLWDVHTGKQIKKLADATVDEVVFAPDGKTLAATTTNYVHIWNIETGKEMHSFHHPKVEKFVFSPDGMTLASLSELPLIGGVFKLWSVPTGQLLHTVKADWQQPSSLVFWPDSKTLLVGGGNLTNQEAGGKVIDKGNGMLNFYDVQSGLLKSRLTLPQGGVINAMALSPDRKIVATNEYGGEGAAIKLWRLK